MAFSSSQTKGVDQLTSWVCSVGYPARVRSSRSLWNVVAGMADSGTASKTGVSSASVTA